MPTLSETARQTQTLPAKPQSPPSFVRAPALMFRHYWRSILPQAFPFTPARNRHRNFSTRYAEFFLRLRSLENAGVQHEDFSARLAVDFS